MSIVTVILAFGVLVLVAHATNISRRDAAAMRNILSALASLGARPMRLSESAVARHLSGSYWLALGHDLAVWNGVELSSSRGNLHLFCATVDAGFGLTKLRRRWAVASFTTAREHGYVLALREPLLPFDGCDDFRPDATSPAIYVRSPRRHPPGLIEALRETVEQGREASIEVHGHVVVLWRPSHRVVDDSVALAKSASALRDRIEGLGRSAQGGAA